MVTIMIQQKLCISVRCACVCCVERKKKTKNTASGPSLSHGRGQGLASPTRRGHVLLRFQSLSWCAGGNEINERTKLMPGECRCHLLYQLLRELGMKCHVTKPEIANLVSLTVVTPFRKFKPLLSVIRVIFMTRGVQIRFFPSVSSNAVCHASVQR